MNINFNGSRVSIIRWNNRGSDALNEVVVERKGKRESVLMNRLTSNQIKQITAWPAWVKIS